MSKSKKKTRVAPKLKKKKISPSLISPVTLSLLGVGFGAPLLAALIAGGYKHSINAKSPAKTTSQRPRLRSRSTSGSTSSRSGSTRTETLSSQHDIEHIYDKAEENNIIDILLGKDKILDSPPYNETNPRHKKGNEMRARALQPKMTGQDLLVAENFQHDLNQFRNLYKTLDEFPHLAWSPYSDEHKRRDIKNIASVFHKILSYADLPIKLKEKEEIFAEAGQNPTKETIDSIVMECRQLDYALSWIFFMRYGFYV